MTANSRGKIQKCFEEISKEHLLIGRETDVDVRLKTFLTSFSDLLQALNYVPSLTAWPVKAVVETKASRYTF